ncbi:MAG TPA: DUF362 domain-containing protein [Candidatus Anoxymicrobiaceae bacterium]
MSNPMDDDLLARFSAELSQKMLEERLERREFLKRAGKVAGAALLSGALGSVIGCGVKEAARKTAASAPASPSAAPGAPAAADLAVAAGGGDPGALARRAVDALGGMGRFVKPGKTVAIKVNGSFMDGPEAGTSTHPSVVAQVVAMCREAGASRVIVTDHTLRGAAETCFARNGVGAAARSAGAEVVAYGGSDSGQGTDVAVPGGTALARTRIYPVVLNADVLITVPKAKNHGSAGLSLGMKNLIGVTADMSNIHNVDLHQGIADLASLVKPDLSIVDASIVLTANGPGGPGPTKAPGIVIASPDFVAADSFACTLFGMTASDVGYVVDAGRMGLGQVDYTKLRVANV